MFAMTQNLPAVKQVWIRAWIAISIVWCIAAAFLTLPIQSPPPLLDEIEARTPQSAIQLRVSCAPWTIGVWVNMTDGERKLCFRSERQADVYFKWFSATSERIHTERTLKQRQITAAKILGGPVLLAFIALVLDWILRGAGKPFLFSDQSPASADRSSCDPVTSWLAIAVLASTFLFLPTGIALLISKSKQGVEATYSYAALAAIALIWVFVSRAKRSKFSTQGHVLVESFIKTYFAAFATVAVWTMIIAAGVIGSMIGKSLFK